MRPSGARVNDGEGEEGEGDYRFFIEARRP